jgi:hypothetical protein
VASLKAENVNPEQIIRQLPPRAGYRVADYVHVGMPVYRITARLFTQVRKKIATIDEFLLRLVRLGMHRTPEIAELLGLNTSFIDDAFSQLLVDDLLTLRSNVERRQRLALTDKGMKALEVSEAVIPEEKTYVIDYDALLRRIVFLRKEQLISGFQAKRLGYKQIRPLLKRPIDATDLSIPDLQKAIQSISHQRDIQRFVLAVNGLYRKRLFFLPAIAILYRSLDGVDLQVAFVVDGKPSKEHDEAFARSDGVHLLGIDRDVAKISDAVEIVTDVLNEAKDIRAQSGSAVPQFPKIHDVMESTLGSEPYHHLSNEQSNDIQQNGVTSLSVHDHRSLLDYGLKFAKHRLMIICPFLHESVFDENFQRSLEHLLRGTVRVYIGFGMPEHENRPPSKSHLNVVQKLESLARRFGHLTTGKVNSHAKLLLVDTTFYVIGSFNWLSFQGDPDRPFRDEQSVLVSIPNMIERKFQEAAALFPAEV